MHPPPFRHEDRLADWPDCFLHLYCCRHTTPSVRSYLTRLGDVRFSELVTRLRCQVCGQAPAPAYLCASQHREACGGPHPDWAIELVAMPAEPPPYYANVAAENLKARKRTAGELELLAFPKPARSKTSDR